MEEHISDMMRWLRTQEFQLPPGTQCIVLDHFHLHWQSGKQRGGPGRSDHVILQHYYIAYAGYEMVSKTPGIISFHLNWIKSITPTETNHMHNL